MTDDNDNEFGFDADEIGVLGQMAGKEEAADLDLDLDHVADDEPQKSMDKPAKSVSEHREYLSEALKSDKPTIESDTSKSSAKGKSSSGLIVGVAGVVVSLVVAAGGYFFVAPMVLGGGQAFSGSFQSQPDNDFRNDLSFTQQGNQQLQQVDSGRIGQALNAGQSVPENFGGFGADEFVSQEPEDERFSFAGDDVSEQSIHRESLAFEPEPESDMYQAFDDGSDVVITPQISDEERMYDSILAEASTIDAPHEAIKIDRNVVTMELQVKRLSQMELEIASTRKSLSDFTSVIDEIRQQTTEIAKTLESNNDDNKRFSDEIKQLSAKVDGQIELQKADIAALKVEMKSIAQKPVAPAVVKSAPAVVAKPASIQKTVAAQEKVADVVAQKPVSLPVPKPKPVTVKAPASSATCAASKVSDNWRVKGVTPSSAYVERMQDGQGLLLKAGVALPGFGTVKSFNPVERSVCTTSGIVRR